jgi:futalosine hydrolase
VPTNTKLDWMVCAATSMELAAWRDGGEAEETFLTGVGIPLTLAQTLDAAGRSRPARLVNVGIAGAYPGSGLAIGDIVVGTSEVYGDLGFELPEPPHFQHIGEMSWGAFYKKTLPLMIFPEFVGAATGRGCTVNLCTGTEATGRLRESLFDAAFETMEGAAVAQAGQLLGIPVCEIRAISNIASHRHMRPENIQLALERLTAYLQKCRETTP